MDAFTVSLALAGAVVVVLLLYKPAQYAWRHYREHCRICKALDRMHARKEKHKQ